MKICLHMFLSDECIHGRSSVIYWAAVMKIFVLNKYCLILKLKFETEFFFSYAMINRLINTVRAQSFSELKAQDNFYINLSLIRSFQVIFFQK